MVGNFFCCQEEKIKTTKKNHHNPTTIQQPTMPPRSPRRKHRSGKKVRSKASKRSMKRNSPGKVNKASKTKQKHRYRGEYEDDFSFNFRLMRTGDDRKLIELQIIEGSAFIEHSKRDLLVATLRNKLIDAKIELHNGDTPFSSFIIVDVTDNRTYTKYLNVISSFIEETKHVNHKLYVQEIKEKYDISFGTKDVNLLIASKKPNREWDEVELSQIKFYLDFLDVLYIEPDHFEEYEYND